jgi:hypothetical protein
MSSASGGWGLPVWDMLHAHLSSVVNTVYGKLNSRNLGSEELWRIRIKRVLGP